MGQTPKMRNALLAGALAGAMLVPGGAVGASGEVAACDNAAAAGCWSAPFSDGGLFDEQPPATPEEAGMLPTASSAVVLPSGRVLYWDGLAGLEDSNVSLTFDAGRTGSPDRSRILDLSGGFDADKGHATPVWLTPNNDTGDGTQQLFCSDQRLLANGKVLAAGGTAWETSDDFPFEAIDPDYEFTPDGLAELYGSKQTRLFSESGILDREDGTKPEGPGWVWEGDRDTEVGPHDMNFGRWYPAIVTLGNGELLAVSGVSKLLWNSSVHDERASDVLPRNVHETETYVPGEDGFGEWTYNGPQADSSLPLFPRIHLLPNGHVFFGGVGQNWSPAGEDMSQMDWNYMKSFVPDENGGSWVTHGLAQFGSRSGAFSTLLTLTPSEVEEGVFEYSDAQILVGGGTLGVSPSTYFATALSEVVSLSGNDEAMTAEATRTADMVNDRWYSSGVLLPNGQVIAVNGADKDEVLLPGTEVAVRQAELFDPATGTWTGLASGARDRTYHNSAVLLADGSVLVGGHAPINLLYGGQGDNSFSDAFGTARNMRDPSFEILYPPYLYNADGTPATRPVINLEGQGVGSYDEPLNFVKPPDSIDFERVVLSRLPSTTHTTDPDQRTVDVTAFVTEQGASNGGADKFQLIVPDDANVLPPGYYYLFALTADGVPSIARTVSIS